ncbi:hypothetical protein NC661_21210 [Aquibacillus koreensis]|uniref:Uncharacterized protein n=1 Tax=Aquibacillus koreensis TaxID=279446 RepID=A0A9X3WS93_9BACI|nr:hypothetical protein [Aquibacillus koreensis]MDC3422866.1 hypothetical protein [Aquibacillus koreensis]
MSKPTNIRLDEVHVALLEAMVEKLKADGVKTNKTDVIQKAIYSFAVDSVLDNETVKSIIDKHYKGFYKDEDWIK